MKRAAWLPLLLLLVGVTAVSAQPTYFKVHIENIGQAFSFSGSGVFNTPVGSTDPAAIGPGGAYEFSIDAAPGSKLSLATMFVQSNDLFYAPGEGGIALWDEAGVQVSGDVTDQFILWDAGTEVNEEPGEGLNQAPRQTGANTGTDENGLVRPVDDGFTYPAADAVIQVTLTPLTETSFMVRIENVSVEGTLTTSTGQMLSVPLAPGVWVVHSGDAPLFTSGEADRGDGLEALAEDGDPSMLGPALGADTGITTILSPGIWAVHTDMGPLFTSGTSDRGMGLEALSEDGAPGTLAANIAMEPVTTGGAFSMPTGAEGPGPLTPGGSYDVTVIAMPGSDLTLATMFVQSNDLFVAPDEGGIPLWDNTGTPISGDVTDQLMLWDAGTEVNEKPGFGLNQAPRQAEANTGATEGGNVRLVDDGFTYPTLSDVMQVTVTPLATVPFTVRVENVSVEGTLTTSTGQMLAVPLAPGTWVVHAGDAPMFSDMTTDRGAGLEALAEDGDPSMLGPSLAAHLGFDSGVFNTPVGASAPAAIGPGEAYEFSFDAAPGSKLSLATMFVQSNDLFYAPSASGIALWDASGTPVSGDITNQFMLWDAGTEVNQEPGEGMDQAPRQGDANTGATEGGTVRLVDDGFTYPATDAVIQVTITATQTGIEDASAVLPKRGFTLKQNYPNPYAQETVIPFELSEPGHVVLEVYNLLGQKVAELADATRSAGAYQVRWTGRDERGAELANGVYFYRLQVGNRSSTRQMVIVR